MRKTIFWVHLCVGVTAGIVIFIMSVTGVLLMYRKQLTSWADGISVTPPSGSAARLPVEDLIAKVAAVETTAPTAITISSISSTPATFSFGREKTLFVDPFTGTILGEGSKRIRTAFQLVIDWHRWLGMQGENRPIGKAITGACNLGFLFLVCSGIYLWWPRNWNVRAAKAVVFFDRTATGKARDWNWHNVIGIWSAIPLAIVVFTAIFFSYPWATEWLYRATGEEPPPRPNLAPARIASTSSAHPNRDKSPNNKTSAPFSFTGLNDSWTKAEAQLPGWRTISLRVPPSPSASLAFTIDQGNGARPDLRGQFTINPKTGEAKWENYESQGAARKIRLWVRWLHTGEAGGWLGQTVAGLASAGGAMLVWTGLSLAIRRFFKRNAIRTESVPEALFVS
jgi:uncharacterized iron-regulated membrane protein